MIRRFAFAISLAFALSTAFVPPLHGQSPTDIEKASALNSEGVDLFKKNEFAKALRRFEQALELDPKSTGIRENIGRAHAAIGIAVLDDIARGRVDLADSRRALESFRTSLLHWSGDATTHHAIGWSHFHLREYSEAEKALVRALELDPKQGRSLRLLSLARERQGDTAGALDALEQLEKVDPSPRWSVRKKRLKFDSEAAETFRKLEDDRFRVLYPKDVPASAAIAVRRTLNAVVDEYAKRWGIRADFPVTVICYPPGEFSNATGLHEDVAGAYDGRIRVAFPAELEEGGLGLESVVRHEALHLLLHSLPKPLPRWLDEGIATRLDGEDRGEWKAQFRRTVVAAPEISLLDRERAYVSDDPKTWAGVYLHGSAFIDHLLDIGGDFRLDLAIQEMARGESWSSAIESVYGASVEDLDRKWRRKLSKPETPDE